ncbi:hemolysin XhlA family protein [Clostridium tyrobutyricum]|uniref:hemolysin XhlA family protein n=1 Tax=Clostridium tyrobutyricum TaxID=1519 RepID=UPI0018A9F78F|nr:hemolysin XhlA family protein [Clostridium tyrobutyricum]MBV4429445.1 hemolysin XhlA family protein [Clostridium tyrobutyricum]MBV4444942.1 hemolysin XhlA family protein [Clostridium tyrobutyricum]MBV4450174.1 hemolysin XhlA family protein [Clostridium tyrobutyricum]
MSENYDSELCAEKHRNIDRTLQEHEQWLKQHDEDISLIKQENSNFKSDIKTLFSKIDNLISTIKWGLGIFVTLSIFIIGILIKK